MKITFYVEIWQTTKILILENFRLYGSQVSYSIIYQLLVIIVQNQLSIEQTWYVYKLAHSFVQKFFNQETLTIKEL